MEKSVLLFWTFCAVFIAVSAKPYPRNENRDEEILAPKDTVHYPYVFWLGRPFYEQDDDDGNTYYERRSSTVSYANVGAGWGR